MIPESASPALTAPYRELTLLTWSDGTAVQGEVIGVTDSGYRLIELQDEGGAVLLPDGTVEMLTDFIPRMGDGTELLDPADIPVAIAEDENGILPTSIGKECKSSASAICILRNGGTEQSNRDFTKGSENLARTNPRSYIWGSFAITFLQQNYEPCLLLACQHRHFPDSERCKCRLD